MVRTVSHPNGHSQYTYGGHNSCTYCSIEACLHFLHDFIHETNDLDLYPLIDNILINGTKMDKKKNGHKSPDEVFLEVDRYAHLLSVVKVSHYDLKIPNSINKLLDTMKTLARESKDKKIAACITKPPETFAIFYNDKTNSFCFFDSHLNNLRGAHFIFGNYIEAENILKIKFMPQIMMEEFSFFESTFLTLGEIKTFFDPSSFEDLSNRVSLPPRKDSSLLYSINQPIQQNVDLHSSISTSHGSSGSYASSSESQDINSSISSSTIESSLPNSNFTQEQYKAIINNLVARHYDNKKNITSLEKKINETLQENNSLTLKNEELTKENNKLNDDNKELNQKLNELESKFKLLLNTTNAKQYAKAQDLEAIIESQKKEIKSLNDFIFTFMNHFQNNKELLDNIQQQHSKQ